MGESRGGEAAGVGGCWGVGGGESGGSREEGRNLSLV